MQEKMSKEFVKKLMQIQKDFILPEEQYSEFSGVVYNSIDDYIMAAKTVCLENGLFLSFIDEFINEGDIQNIKVTAMVTDGESSYSVDGFSAIDWNKPKMDRSQMTISATSYATKQAITNLFLPISKSSNDRVIQEQMKLVYETIKSLQLGYTDEEIVQVINSKGAIPALLRAVAKATNK